MGESRRRLSGLTLRQGAVALELPTTDTAGRSALRNHDHVMRSRDGFSELGSRIRRASSLARPRIPLRDGQSQPESGTALRAHLVRHPRSRLEIPYKASSVATSARTDNERRPETRRVQLRGAALRKSATPPVQVGRRIPARGSATVRIRRFQPRLRSLMIAVAVVAILLRLPVVLLHTLAVFASVPVALVLVPSVLAPQNRRVEAACWALALHPLAAPDLDSDLALLPVPEWALSYRQGNARG